VTSAGSRHDPFAPGTYESLVHLGQRHRPQVEIPVRSLHPADRLAHTEALEVVGPEGREDLLEFLRVDVPDAEYDPGARVREHSRQDVRVFRDLAEIVVREDEAQAVLAGAREVPEEESVNIRSSGITAVTARGVTAVAASCYIAVA
jgi:hypothetical protein